MFKTITNKRTVTNQVVVVYVLMFFKENTFNFLSLCALFHENDPNLKLMRQSIIGWMAQQIRLLKYFIVGLENALKGLFGFS